MPVNVHLNKSNFWSVSHCCPVWHRSVVFILSDNEVHSVHLCLEVRLSKYYSGSSVTAVFLFLSYMMFIYTVDVIRNKWYEHTHDNIFELVSRVCYAHVRCHMLCSALIKLKDNYLCSNVPSCLLDEVPLQSSEGVFLKKGRYGRHGWCDCINSLLLDGWGLYRERERGDGGRGV